MTKARDLADFVSAGNPLADGTIDVADINGITATTAELNYTDGVTSNIQTQLDAKLPLSGGTMTGDITFSGTQLFDGRDVSADGTTLDGLPAAYQSYTDTAIANLVDTAPSTLDTLNELAAALGDDPNFATTVTNSIATKLALSGGTMTGDITFNSTQLFDGRDVSADGTKLDGIEAGADVTDTTNVTAAGALMDSELTNITAVKALNQGVATTDSPTFAGGTFTGNVSFGDSDKINLGAANDLQIYHDGANSLIQEAGAGDLILKSNGAATVIKTNAGSNLISARDAGSVGVFHNGSEKLTTTSTGVDVTGTITADGLDMEDNQKILLGASDDLQIYHSDGGASYIADVGAGDLYIQGDANVVIRNSSGTENKAVFATNGAVSLYYDNSQKFATTSYGVSVSGSAVASTLTGSVSGSVTLGFDSYQNFVLTLTGNVTLANPTTEKVGQSGFITFIHSGAGRTVSLGTDYETAGGAGLTLSATSGATDIVPYIVAASGRILLGTPQLAFS